MKSIARVATDLQAGTTTSRELVEGCRERIASPAGEGARTFLKVHHEAAAAAADYHDALRRAGGQPSPWSGIPLSIKDLFDVAGDVTTAGSIVLRNDSPARADALAVARLRAAGFIPIGRTNMTEFAFSGLGLNPHFGTPLNPFERSAARIPGGSSSGAAISITDEMAFGALGTDTGGSCRIPAAFCGIVGFKPTSKRIPLTGVTPLSSSLDSIGSLAPTVECCAILDSILAAESRTALQPISFRGLRYAVPQAYVLDGLDDQVGRCFERALSALAGAGAHIVEVPLRLLTELPGINAKGGFPAAEGYAFHRDRLASCASEYDPRVATRILRGRDQSAADYIELMRARSDFQRRLTEELSAFDAALMPTVPVIAPRLAELESDSEYTRLNLLVLRNPSVANFSDGCAISIPCHQAGGAPVGLMLMMDHGADRRLLAMASAVEALVSPKMETE
jgi:aspartyl-tRNA(Asn)/glutamyl-tRNA(Gln) amidotransferase subunit A